MAVTKTHRAQRGAKAGDLVSCNARVSCPFGNDEPHVFLDKDATNEFSQLEVLRSLVEEGVVKEADFGDEDRARYNELRRLSQENEKQWMEENLHSPAEIKAYMSNRVSDVDRLYVHEEPARALGLNEEESKKFDANADYLIDLESQMEKHKESYRLNKARESAVRELLDAEGMADYFRRTRRRENAYARDRLKEARNAAQIIAQGLSFESMDHLYGDRARPAATLDDGTKVNEEEFNRGKELLDEIGGAENLDSYAQAEHERLSKRAAEDRAIAEERFENARARLDAIPVVTKKIEAEAREFEDAKAEFLGAVKRFGLGDKGGIRRVVRGERKRREKESGGQKLRSPRRTVEKRVRALLDSPDTIARVELMSDPGRAAIYMKSHTDPNRWTRVGEEFREHPDRETTTARLALASKRVLETYPTEHELNMAFNPEYRKTYKATGKTPFERAKERAEQLRRQADKPERFPWDD